MITTWGDDVVLVAPPGKAQYSVVSTIAWTALAGCGVLLVCYTAVKFVRRRINKTCSAESHLPTTATTAERRREPPPSAQRLPAQPTTHTSLIEGAAEENSIHSSSTASHAPLIPVSRGQVTTSDKQLPDCSNASDACSSGEVPCPVTHRQTFTPDSMSKDVAQATVELRQKLQTGDVVQSAYELGIFNEALSTGGFLHYLPSCSTGNPASGCRSIGAKYSAPH